MIRQTPAEFNPHFDSCWGNRGSLYMDDCTWTRTRSVSGETCSNPSRGTWGEALRVAKIESQF